MVAPLSDPARGTNVLLFGPQVLSFHEQSFSQLRSTLLDTPEHQWILDTTEELVRYWEILSRSLPRLLPVPGTKLLKDLNEWLKTGNFTPTAFPLPNVLLTPLVVITELTQYLRYLDMERHVPSERHDLHGPTKQNTETLGFCTGLLSAVAVASSSNQAQFRQHGAVAIRLAMLIGGLVDAQDRSGDLYGESKSFSAAWNSPECGAEMVRILEDFPEAYISVHYDERRTTVTTSKSTASTLMQALKAAGVTIAEVSLSGRYHCECYSNDIEPLNEFCDSEPAFQFPNASELVLPTRLNSGGEYVTHGKLHHVVLRSILVEQSRWYQTFAAVQSLCLEGNESIVVAFGPDRCVPPSLRRKLGPRVLQFADVDNAMPPLSSSMLNAKTSIRSQNEYLDNEIAVVGMSCKVAGADDLEEFWKILCDGKSQHVEVPGDRFGFESTWRDNDPKKKWYGNFIRDQDAFDHKFFKKSPREIASTDPQQRMMLQVAYQAVEQSGYFQSPDIDKHVLGIIGGTAVYQNQNCTAITVPNEESLSDLFRNVIRQAKLDPKQISVVEAHGTGTPVGDPAEYESIRQVFGGSVRSNTLSLGSVKGLIGHTECASGIIALIKTLLMVQEGFIPPQASFDTINPALNASASDQIEITRGLKPWKSAFRAALINNYGASGSNASMVVTEALNCEPFAARNLRIHSSNARHPFWFCGIDDEALRLYSARLRQLFKRRTVSAKGFSVANLAFNVSHQSNRIQCRALILTCDTIERLDRSLEAFEHGDESVPSITRPEPRPVVLCFGGQVSTFVGLDKEVFESAKVLRSHLDDCNSTCQDLGLDGIYPEIFQRTPVDDAVKFQTALFAIQYSCAKSWMDCGLEVAAVIGHSFGELTALCVAGSLSLKDALKMIAKRASFIRDSWGDDKGSMMAVEANLEDVEKLLAESNDSHQEDDAAIACFNGPRSFTIAGPTKSIKAAEETVAQRQEFRSSIKAKKLRVSNAFHSSLTNPLLSELEQMGESLRFERPAIRIERATVSTPGEELTAKFPAEHMKNPVHFSQAVQRLSKRFSSCFWLEAGSNSTITTMASRALGQSNASHFFQPINITCNDSLQLLADATANLWREGLNVSFWPHHSSQTSEYMPLLLPPYQFQKYRHWVELKKPPQRNTETVVKAQHGEDKPKGLWSFVGYQDDERRSVRFCVNTSIKKFEDYVSGHTIAQAAPLCPSTLQLDIAIEALSSLRPASKLQPQLRGLENHAPMCIDYSRQVWLEALASDADVCDWDWKMTSSATEGNSATTVNVSGKIIFQDADDAQIQSDFARYERLVGHERCLRLLEGNDVDDVIKGRNIYKTFAEIVDYGEVYRGVQKIVGKGSESAGRVVKAYSGETWLDTPLSDSFCQVVRVHDLENPPAEDLLHSQHIVIANNCVHATRSLTNSTQKIHSVLRLDGFLMMLEMTDTLYWVDMIFGLLEGWWLFDDGRQHAVTHQTLWDKSLRSVGYGHVDWTEGNRPEANLQRIIIALAAGPRYERLPKPLKSPTNETTDCVARQAAVDKYILKYSQDCAVPVRSNIPWSPRLSDACVLLTGATGSLGSHLVAHFTALPNVKSVICLNRRSSTEPTLRQRQAIESRGITLNTHALSKLKCLETDTSVPDKLGLPSSEYDDLVHSVTHIVHNAWPMSIKRPVKGFEKQFSVMQNLIRFASDASGRRPHGAEVGFQFISSIATVGHHPLVSGSVRVLEERMKVESVLPSGYSDAKLVCERMLDETLHKFPDRFRAMTVRIGQIAGSKTSGYWNPVEHLSFLIKSSQTLKVLPDFQGELSWDLLVSEATPYPIYHIENPARQPWHQMVPVLADALDIPHTNIIPFEDWVRRVRQFPGSEADNPAINLVEFLDDHFIRMSCGGLVLDTTKSKEHSETLANVGPVSTDVVKKYVRVWKEMGFLCK